MKQHSCAWLHLWTNWVFLSSCNFPCRGCICNISCPNYAACIRNSKDKKTIPCRVHIPVVLLFYFCGIYFVIVFFSLKYLGRMCFVFPQCIFCICKWPVLLILNCSQPNSSVKHFLMCGQLPLVDGRTAIWFISVILLPSKIPMMKVEVSMMRIVL